ncbi:MAG: hypothetical protein ACJAWS_000676 [Oleiphilaceae bacterium]|jgi:hypothetical protein
MNQQSMHMQNLISDLLMLSKLESKDQAQHSRVSLQRQKHTNQINSGVMSIFERVFGVLKLHYEMSKARYLGLSQNKAPFGLMSLTYNIKRGVSIQRTLKTVAG